MHRFHTCLRSPKCFHVTLKCVTTFTNSTIRDAKSQKLMVSNGVGQLVDCCVLPESAAALSCGGDF